MTVTISGTNGIDAVQSGVVAPGDLTTGSPSWDSSANFQFNSGYGSVATAYGCRAWVNFNGTGTVAIRASGNVSSITDGGTGQYTVNFTNAMPDANYSVNFNGGNTVSNSGSVYTFGTFATGSVGVRFFEANAYADANPVCVTVVR